MADNLSGVPKTSQFEARYANHFRIVVTDEEFIIDFGQQHSEESSAFWHSRIVTTPSNAMKLLELIQNALSEESGTPPPDN